LPGHLPPGNVLLMEVSPPPFRQPQGCRFFFAGMPEQQAAPANRWQRRWLGVPLLVEDANGSVAQPYHPAGWHVRVVMGERDGWRLQAS